MYLKLTYEAKHIVKHVMSLIDSHNFLQCVSSPTHNLGHMLDLILSSGLSLHSCEVFDAGISDHCSVLFEPAVPYVQPILSQHVCSSRVFHATTAPLKPRKRKARSSPQPLLNASTRALRQECRRAEHRWKKDGLHKF